MLAPELEDVPWGQLMHDCDPEADAYFPAAHAVQTEGDPNELNDVPGGQAVRIEFSQMDHFGREQKSSSQFPGPSERPHSKAQSCPLVPSSG